MIVEIGMFRTGKDPGAVGAQETDCRSFDSARLPSFFLYDTEPMGGAMLEGMRIGSTMHLCSATVELE